MGDDLSLAWVIAGLISVVAFVLAVRAGTERGRTAGLRAEIEELHKEIKGSRKQREQRDKSLRRSESELEKASRKLGQVEKRKSRGKESARAERREAADRIRDLEVQIAHAGQRAESLAQDVTRAREELDASAAQVTRAEAEIEELQQLVAAKPALADPEEVQLLQERAELAEQKLSEQDDPLGKAIQEIERLKQKARTQETLYTSIRSELLVKKEQIRQQREEIERLQATKVALGAIDPA